MYNDPNELLTIDELCNAFSIGRNAAYRLLNEKKSKHSASVEFGKSAVWL